MKEAEVKARAFAMPLTSPAYPPGPYRFVNREFMIITYRTDLDRLRALVPEPLEVDEPLVKYEFIRLLKIIPHVDGTPRICELVEYGLEDVTLKGAWTGPAALSLTPHALAPVAELPVLEVVSAVHMVCDLTLGLGKVVHDYLAPASLQRKPAPSLAPANAGVS